MTAIEVLVATLLASLMLGSIVGVLGGLARQERALRKRVSIPPQWHLQLAEQLQWDLSNSREYVASPDSVTLVGFAGRDFATDQPTGRPTEIAYYLVDAIDDRWLVRREEHRDERTDDSSRIEILCGGVERLQFGESVVDQAVRASGRSTSSNPTIATPIPERVAIKLHGRAENAPMFDMLFMTR
jgi:hypothetical protein